MLKRFLAASAAEQAVPVLLALALLGAGPSAAQFDCSDCHEVETASPAHADVACVDCHAGIDDYPHPEEALEAVASGQVCAQCHDLALPAGSAHPDLGCLDCHGPAHEIQWGSVSGSCQDCHFDVQEDFATSAHAGQTEIHCLVCHGPTHDIHAVDDPKSRVHGRNQGETCSECHEQRALTFGDSFHGKATGLGFLSAANCTDCHTPHLQLPADDPRSSVHLSHLQETCGACHPNATAGFLSFDPHSDPHDPESSHPVVHGIYFFMTSLLVGVFCFFGLHSLLWFQRSFVGWVRGEFPGNPIHTTGEKWVRRFRGVHVVVHIVVVVTFLALAATGLPLKYHFADWAQFLAGLPLGLEGARVIHRVAAVLTFGYLAFHVGHIVYRSLVRKEAGLFAGRRSMVPSLDDLRDLVANFRYFLYMGPRPQMGRWTYWEKFDYFAVFWGVPVIGISGLMLWFPELVTRWLPGWTLNAAMVVHSDEALLATGFIFTFHFFHTHVRPESFPIDLVIFTGSMPLSRFREERPREYQRMVEDGTLEERLVDPPSTGRRLAASIFGFAALGTGIFLAVGILVGMLLY